MSGDIFGCHTWRLKGGTLKVQGCCLISCNKLDSTLSPTKNGLFPISPVPQQSCLRSSSVLVSLGVGWRAGAHYAERQEGQGLSLNNPNLRVKQFPGPQVEGENEQPQCSHPLWAPELSTHGGHMEESKFTKSFIGLQSPT